MGAAEYASNVSATQGRSIPAQALVDEPTARRAASRTPNAVITFVGSQNRENREDSHVAVTGQAVPGLG